MIFESLKSIENKIKKLGYKKTYDEDKIIEFQMEDKQFHFIHEVSIIHKQSGKHLIQSYQKGTPKGENFWSPMVGLTFEETELFLKYAKKLKW